MKCHLPRTFSGSPASPASTPKCLLASCSQMSTKTLAGWTFELKRTSIHLVVAWGELNYKNYSGYTVYWLSTRWLATSTSLLARWTPISNLNVYFWPLFQFCKMYFYNIQFFDFDTFVRSYPSWVRTLTWLGSWKLRTTISLTGAKIEYQICNTLGGPCLNWIKWSFSASNYLRI